MHYTISTKVLGQTHMWYTQNKRSNFLKIFQFLWFLNFLNTLKNRTVKEDQQKIKTFEDNTKPIEHIIQKANKVAWALQKIN